MGQGETMPATTTRFTYCRKGHAPMFHVGKNCPLCAQQKATVTIAKEYFKVSSMVNQLLAKLRIKKAA
jgi:hypothetical protein